MTTSETARPRGAPAVRAARLVVDAVIGFVREFLWGSLREGAIRLTGMSAAMGTVVVLSAALLVLTTISFTAGDLLRTGRDLLVIPGGVSGRGSLVPEPLVPLTFAVVAVGCALLLSGALHATLPIRIGVLVLYATIATAFMGLASTLESTSGIPVWPAWLLLLAVIAVYGVRWRAAPRPAAEFALLLTLVGGTLAISALGLVRSDEITGRGFALQQLDLLLGLLVGLSIPLLLVAGLDTIGFGLDATTWLIGFLGRRLTLWAAFVALGVLVAWRLYDIVGLTIDDLRDGGAAETLLSVVGALVLVAAIWAYWYLLRRLAGRAPGQEADEDAIDHASARVRLPLGFAYVGITFVLFPVLLLLNALSHFGVGEDAAVFEGIGAVAAFMGTDLAVTTYRVLLAVVMLAVGAWLARRGNTTLAIFIGAIGVSDLVAQAFANVDALGSLLWDGPHPLDVAWMATFVGAGLWWALRRSLTLARAERLAFLILLGALLSHFDFVADPLAPVLGFAGIGFVVFGFVWGFLTGGAWTNQDSARFPRPSRVYLYLGYSLLSIALLNWFSVTHDVGQLSSMQAAGENGVTLLGYPLLYALFMLVLAGAVANRRVAEAEDDLKISAPAVDS